MPSTKPDLTPFNETDWPILLPTLKSHHARLKVAKQGHQAWSTTNCEDCAGDAFYCLSELARLARAYGYRTSAQRVDAVAWAKHRKHIRAKAVESGFRGERAANGLLAKPLASVRKSTKMVDAIAAYAGRNGLPAGITQKEILECAAWWVATLQSNSSSTTGDHDYSYLADKFLPTSKKEDLSVDALAAIGRAVVQWLKKAIDADPVASRQVDKWACVWGGATRATLPASSGDDEDGAGTDIDQRGDATSVFNGGTTSAYSGGANGESPLLGAAAGVGAGFEPSAYQAWVRENLARIIATAAVVARGRSGAASVEAIADVIAAEYRRSTGTRVPRGVATKTARKLDLGSASYRAAVLSEVTARQITQARVAKAAGLKPSFEDLRSAAEGDIHRSVNLRVAELSADQLRHFISGHGRHIARRVWGALKAS